jgi:transcriptional regulator with XRE-family HTH domain
MTDERKPAGEPKPVDAHVGARIRLRRQLLGMSQEALGGQIGVTFQQVQKYERGSNRVGASRLVQIACALQVQPGYFFEGIAPDGDGLPAPEDAALIAFLRSREGLALTTAWMRVAEPGLRRKLLEFVQALSTKAAPESGNARREAGRSARSAKAHAASEAP